MVIALIALVLNILGMGTNSGQAVTIVPPMPMHAPTNHVISERDEWVLYNQEAYYDYASQFTDLFNSYETKRASNGALLIRQGNSGKYKFAKKG